jgi:hypothetical protein
LDKKIGFKAEVADSPQEGLQIKSEGSIYNIYKEQLVDLWQHIRSLGFVLVESMPDDLERFAPYLIAIFHHLPYLKPALITNHYKQMDNDSIGLQFIPGIHENIVSAGKIHEVTDYEQ